MLGGIVALSLFLALGVSSSSPEDYINILGGTDSRKDFSHGNTLPLITRPWGFGSWSIQSNNNNEDPTWFFHPKDRGFYGLRNTRQPSPWISDYGEFLLTASFPTVQKRPWSGYSPSAPSSVWSPWFFQTTLLAYGTPSEQTRISFSASRHGGIMRVNFPPQANGYANSGFDQSRRISVLLGGGNDSAAVSIIDGATFITGVSRQSSGGMPSEEGAGQSFGHYFAAGIFFGKDGNNLEAGAVSPSDSSAGPEGAWVQFDAANPLTDVITVRVATSFLSPEQALVNLRREVGVDKSLEQLSDEGRAEWRSQVSKMSLDEVGAGYSPEEQAALKTTFYSAQYRASLFPRQLSEIAEDGREVHWSPYDGATHAGPLAADSGFWDAYSTLYPLHSLVNLDVLGPQMLTGWLNAFQEGGWLPKWSSPGFRTNMVGTMGDVTLSDAIVKKVPGFDQLRAYEAVRKDAFEVPPADVEGVGRVCLPAYLQHGYIPAGSPMTTGGECYEVVSRTLNYLQSDWAIAQAARSLGHHADADVLLGRASNYSLQFNPVTGLFQSRSIHGLGFSEAFDQFAWGGDYTEAGPYQYRFYVPYDPKGLAALYAKSGRDVCQELTDLQTMQSTYHMGAYSEEIHEQTEMAENCWGQLEHNNQPTHHILWMFAAVDPTGTLTGPCSARGQMYLRKAMASFYKPGADAFVGDEDNGQMSAWFLLSTVGLYALAPGSTVYSLGSPLFARVSLALPGQKRLVVEAKNNGPSNVYVRSATFNGTPLTGTTIEYSLLMQGGTLSFDMSDKPLVDSPTF